MALRDRTSTYHVWLEHTLIYKPRDGMFHGILACDRIKGGADPMRGLCLPLENELREATVDDFHRFRVCPNGHFD